MSSDPRALAIAAGNLARISELRAALEILQAADVPAAVSATADTVAMLSGAGPYELQRACVLVSERDRARASDALARAGWREEWETRPDPSVRVFKGRARAVLVIETSVAPGSAIGRRFSIPQALGRATAVRAGDATLRALAPIDRLLALCARGDAKNWPRKYIVAAAALLREHDDARLVIDRARQAGLRRAVFAAALRVRDVLGTDTAVTSAAARSPIARWQRVSDRARRRWTGWAPRRRARRTSSSGSSSPTAAPSTRGSWFRRTKPAAAARQPRRIILRQWQAPGDVVMLTAAVRDLHVLHPGRFLTDVRTHCPDLWDHNPYLTRLDEADPAVEAIDCHYPLIHQSNQRPVHFLHGFIEFLNERLDLRMLPTAFRGDIHLSPAERQRPSIVREILGEDLPYWIVAAGGKYDFTIKWWSRERFQSVVDRLRGRVFFVQVGEADHHHPPIDGALDLRGRTSLRDLIHLVHHADGVVTPVSLLMHLAAAVEPRGGWTALRPCVVIAGGREPVHWEAYPGHQFLHTIGALPCCASGGCWRSRTLPLLDDDSKNQPDQLCLDVVDGLPHCMDAIAASDVIRAVEHYLSAGAARTLTDRQSDRARRVASARARAADVEAPATPRWCRPCPPAEVRAGADVTICVLTYGDHLALVRRCLESIARFVPRDRYRLVAGANAVSADVREYLYEARHAGGIDRLHESPTNINKNPMMRRMFAGLDTDLVWWFDDDSHVVEPLALERRLEIVRAAGPSTAMWGHKHFFWRMSDWAGDIDVAAFIRSAAWYRGRPLPGDTVNEADPRWWFATGGSWLARTAAIREMDWPDPRLIMASEDVFLGEAVRQQGWDVADVGSCGVAISDAPRRGTGSDRETLERQVAVFR